MTEPDYSTPIYAIAAWLQRHGVTVHLYARWLPCSGLYRSETREVFVHEPTARAALLTLAHEAGHWLGYLIDERPHSYQRERQAFVYGWWVLRQFGAPITRAEWIAAERERREAPGLTDEEERCIADRIGDLVDIAPPGDYVERAMARAREAGVL